MRVLITGADGFAGQHLIRELTAVNRAVELHGTSFRSFPSPAAPVIYHTVDLRDEQAVSELTAELRPERVYHLAAKASPKESETSPWSALENNILAQLNLTLACLKLRPTPRLLVVSSGEIYGDQPSDKPTNEEAPFRPANPYSVSKIAQDMLALQYFISQRMPTLRARPFNHLGPGQSPGFVAPDFALKIARIEAGQQEPVMRVGDLTAERDFTDVRDVVRAYRLIMERGTLGDVYNIATGKTCTVRALLDTLLSYCRVPITVEPDPAFRASAVKKTWGDSSRLRTATGWQPTIPLQQTLRDVLDDCRQRVQALT